uniref:Uncharacterized protein n=1 Tax=Oryzias latipes TaxID=8090 RepID=A0A3P9I9Z9_ORYLA
MRRCDGGVRKGGSAAVTFCPPPPGARAARREPRGRRVRPPSQHDEPVYPFIHSSSMHHPHPPSFSPTGAAVSSCLFILQSCRLLRCSAENVSVKSGLNIVTSVKKNGFLRLPGLCRRLKRRRVTLLVEINISFVVQKISPGQVCRCPRHSKCSHFFLHSL